VPDSTPLEILVVDDELADLQLMCNILRRVGYTVVPASGYLAAINTFRLKSGRFALVVTDVSLPKKNGCELARALLALQPDLKVLFVSATSGAEVCRYYDMLGPGLHFLEKPFKRNEFLTLVRLILENGEVYPLARAGAP
jgi:two-component system cell cycle sensor histidine kinase/response regulator CckA